MSSSSCTTSSSLGVGVSIIFGTIYGLILIVVTIYSNSLLTFNNKFASAGCCKKLKLWMMDVYKRRRCYLPVITHLADLITDIAVTIQFGELATNT
eukprot:280127_1